MVIKAMLTSRLCLKRSMLPGRPYEQKFGLLGAVPIRTKKHSDTLFRHLSSGGSVSGKGLVWKQCIDRTTLICIEYITKIVATHLGDQLK